MFTTHHTSTSPHHDGMDVPSPTDEGISDEHFQMLGDKNAPVAWMDKVEGLWKFSGMILPDSLKRNPYTKPGLLLAIAIFIVLPIKMYVILAIMGFALGLLLNPHMDRDELARAELIDKAARLISGSGSGFPEEKDFVPTDQRSISLSPKIDGKLDALLGRLITSLIDPWFMPQNKSGQREFQSCVRSTLDAALVILGGILGGLGEDSLTLYLYGLTNALIIHMQEYKRWAKGEAVPQDFLLSPEALRTFYPNMQAEVGHFRQLMSILLRRLLPKQEARSIVVTSLLKEVIASGAFWNALDRLCDPDFINMKLVDALKDKSDLKLEPGWSLVVVKVIKGRSLPLEDPEGGLYCLVHIAGRKVRTRRVSQEEGLWNECFQFKVSNHILGHLKLHVQLLKYSYMGQDTSYGYARLAPEVIARPQDAKQSSWVRFKAGGEVLLETYVLSSAVPSEVDKPAEPRTVDNNSVASLPRVVQEVELPIEEFTMESCLKDNELFMEFYEFLNEFNAPPYLQFFMNYEAFKQFTAMELGVDPVVPVAIDNYFKTGPLSTQQREQLRMIKSDAMDLFETHFLEGSAKHRIEINETLRSQLVSNLKASDRTDAEGRFVGETLIGPNIFIPVHQWIFSVLKDVYFDKFKASQRFQRLRVRTKFSTSNFTFEDECDEQSTIMDTDDLRSQVATEDLAAPSDDAEMDIKKISTAIALLKQQLAVIEDKLESASGDTDTLLRSKKDFERQVQGLLKLIKEKEGEMGQQAEGPADFWLDLRNVTVKVRRTADGDSTSSLWSSDPVFDIEVVRLLEGVDETLTLSVVSKALSDFETLHRRLRRDYPKLRKVDLPTTTTDLASGLESYLLLLVSDEFIRQSLVLREFVSLDSDLEAKPLATSAGQIVEAVVGKRVKGALQTASSILSVGMIGGGKSKKTASRFYETRDHHTTSELSSGGGDAQSQPDLSRSRSLSSFVSEDKARATPPPPPPFKSVPPTPVKRSSKLSADETPSTSSTASSVSPQIFQVKEISEAELDMLMESIYTFVTETFDLREPNQWIRRKVLSLSKQFVKQAYGDSLSKALTKGLNDALTEGAILRYLDIATDVLWPNGIFIKDVPPPIRSAEQQLATQIEARALLLSRVPEALERLAGRYNAVNGMTRIFNLLQQKDFNKLLFITLLDITIKIVFTEQPK